MSERFTTTTFTAAGSQDYQWNFANHQTRGLTLQVKPNSSLVMNILADNYDDNGATFTDITSQLTGAGTIGPNGGLWFSAHWTPHRVRINVTSIAGACPIAIGI